MWPTLPILPIHRVLHRVPRTQVTILVGGPDWPTSVLTGILRLHVTEMLLGSLPVILLIIPTVFTGGFLLRVNDGGAWASVAGMTLTLTAVVQLTAMIAAGYFIEKVRIRVGLCPFCARHITVYMYFEWGTECAATVC